MKLDDEKEREGEKGAMTGGGRHEFFVVNLTDEKLKGHVLWKSSRNEIKLDVNGLEPGKSSPRKQFFPSGGNRDYWRWSERGREYQLNLPTRLLPSAATESGCL
ncbi:hypothetical protein [Bradyrhizobium arachidis]|uniref:hypothetical protein n=1 Tax=Bradyrhizobium arachidis TaxID=858423 RepID=UPI002163536B|nr:hypothetical protein [Bradyrhizobium arachidis]UVO30521.1 hypothetical protein KUF59_07560 [Bradyrhizobium arachidis]